MAGFHKKRSLHLLSLLNPHMVSRGRYPDNDQSFSLKTKNMHKILYSTIEGEIP